MGADLLGDMELEGAVQRLPAKLPSTLEGGLLILGGEFRPCDCRMATSAAVWCSASVLSAFCTAI